MPTQGHVLRQKELPLNEIMNSHLQMNRLIDLENAQDLATEP
jgi:hypothetical protein